MSLERFLPAALILAALAACSSVPVEAPSAPAPVVVPPRSAASAPAPVVTKRGGGFYKDDGPGDNAPPALDEIPDAVPRIEPIKAATARPYAVMGQKFTPMSEVKPFSQTGVGSWYGRKFHGAKTSSGELYDMYGMTAAHPTLPIPSYARVTNVENGRQVVVRVNDRGPFLHSRIMDLSYTAAWKLGYVNKGSARLQVDVITPDEIASGSFTHVAPPVSTVPDPIAAIATAQAPVVREMRPEPLVSPASAGAGVSLPAAKVDEALLAAPGSVEKPGAIAGSAVFLQLGAFVSSANAESFRDYIQTELKWLEQSVSTQRVGDKYRLRVGPFRDVSEARNVADRIAARIGTKPFVVQ